jgi:hypothetical protein
MIVCLDGFEVPVTRDATNGYIRDLVAVLA